MVVDEGRAYRAARRAYELGRLRQGLQRALVVTAGAGGLTLIAVGSRAMAWLPVTAAIWVIVEWRGAWLREGARRGLLLGAASLLLPLSILRPCCTPEAMASGAGCCGTGMSSSCAGVGVLLGLSMVLLLPRAPRVSVGDTPTPRPRRAEAGLGMALGAAALATLRCGPLLLGETVGLLGGLMAGVLAASLAGAAWMSRRAA